MDSSFGEHDGDEAIKFSCQKWKRLFLKNWFVKDTTAFQISHQFYIPWH